MTRKDNAGVVGLLTARLLLGLALVGSLFLAGPVQADARKGKWSALGTWPLIPIHAVLLPDGRVFTYGTDALLRATGTFIYDVWSPKQGLGSAAHLTLPNATGTDFFCNAQLVLPSSGELFMAGGDIWNGTRTIHRGNSDSALFDPGSNTLAAGAGMQRKRYYATVTTLADGRTYIQGGRDGEDRPEIRGTDGSFRLLTGIDTTGLFYYYPRAWVTPTGRLFGYSDRADVFRRPGRRQPDRCHDAPVDLPAGAAERGQLQRGHVRAGQDPARRRRRPTTTRARKRPRRRRW